MAINGTANSESIPGTSGPDAIDFSQGGNDSVTGAAGDDTISGGNAFTAADQVNGNAGFDILKILGNSYAGGVVFNANTVRNIESFEFDGGGFNYAVATHDATINAGQQLKVDAYLGTAGNSITFDASAETDGSILAYDGLSNDTFIGGAQSDYLIFTYNGADTGIGNGGDDIFSLGGALDAADHMDGGAGSDFLYLDGNYSVTLNVTGSMLTSIEGVGLSAGNVYDLKLADSVIAAGGNMFFDGRGLSGAGRMIVDASQELDGTISTIDGINADLIYGSQNADDIRLATGQGNTFLGLGGDDQFLLGDTLDDTDQIDGGTGNDFVSLTGDYGAGLTLTDTTLVSVENVGLYDSGHNYRITTADGNVAAGETMTFSAGTTAANTFYFNGAAETDGSYSLGGGAGNDTLRGGQQGDYIADQNGGVEHFYGNGGNDTFQFWDLFTTDDYANGGTGDDRVTMDTDLSAGVTLGSDQFVSIESMGLGGEFDIRITALDTLVAAGKSMAIDTYYLDAAYSFIFNGSAETDGSYRLTGGIGDDSLRGGAGDDTLDGGQNGSDTLVGGQGNDHYYSVDNATIIEGPAGGEHDAIHADGNFSLQAYATIEDLYLSGNSPATGTGNAANNYLEGSNGTDLLQGMDGNDTLYGAFGDDTLEGGAGNDTYLGYGFGDQIVELSGGGRDTIVYNYYFSLVGLDQIENLVLEGGGAWSGTGNDLNNRIDGNSYNNLLEGGRGNDTLIGNGGNDTLDGGGAGDSMVGGQGNDTYVSNANFDYAVEEPGEGLDTVQSSVAYQLGANVERLFLTGNYSINGNGNGLANLVVGNGMNNVLRGLGGDDTLNGGGGNDTLEGGTGNDTLSGGGSGDLFRFEQANAGVDRILDFDILADHFDLSGLQFTARVEFGGNTILAFAGGTIGVDGVTGLSLALWNDLVI